MIQLEGKIPKLLALLILCLISGGLFTLIATLLVEPIFGETIENTLNVGAGSVKGIKFIQLFSSIGLFVAPAFLFAFLFQKRPIYSLRLSKGASLSSYLLIVALLYSLLPIINLTAELNGQFQLPEYLKGLEHWMKNSEEKAMELTKTFLVMESPMDLLYNIILIGIVPAVGEELIFRGVVQQTISNGMRNHHVGIWVSAALFSAIHLQFYGFIPRMLLGAFFGYLLVISGSIWLPIFAHFLNNATAVILAYFVGIETMEEKLDKIGATQDTLIYSAVSLIVFVFLMRFFKKSVHSPYLK